MIKTEFFYDTLEYYRKAKILQENNFQYDSSLIGKQSNLVNEVREIPVSNFNLFFLKLPLGGWFFRILPYWFLSLILKKKNRQGQTPVLYLHMMDLWPEIPMIKLPYFVKKIKYWGIKKAWRKLEKLLKEFETVRVDSLIK